MRCAYIFVEFMSLDRITFSFIKHSKACMYWNWLKAPPDFNPKDIFKALKMYI